MCEVSRLGKEATHTGKTNWSLGQERRCKCCRFSKDGGDRDAAGLLEI